MTKFVVGGITAGATSHCLRVDREFDRQLSALGLSDRDHPVLCYFWQGNPEGAQVMTTRADGKSICRFVPLAERGAK